MSLVNLIVVSCAVPNDAVVHSPTPSTVKIAASSNGEVKKACAA